MKLTKKKLKAQKALYYEQNREKARIHILRVKYNMTLAEYNKMLKEQNGVCFLCEKPETRNHGGRIDSLSVDHCHDTGLVRRLLCSSCNTAIGLLKHDARLIQAAAWYVNTKGMRKTRGEA